MPSLPIGKYDNPRSLLAQDTRNFQLIFPSVFDATVSNVEGGSPGSLQNAGGFGRLTLAIFCRATRAHLAPGQVKDARAITELRHLQQRASTSLLHVVAMGGDGENVESVVSG